MYGDYDDDEVSRCDDMDYHARMTVLHDWIWVDGGVLENMADQDVAGEYLPHQMV